MCRNSRWNLSSCRSRLRLNRHRSMSHSRSLRLNCNPSNRNHSNGLSRSNGFSRSTSPRSYISLNDNHRSYRQARLDKGAVIVPTRIAVGPHDRGSALCQPPDCGAQPSAFLMASKSRQASRLAIGERNR